MAKIKITGKKETKEPDKHYRSDSGKSKGRNNGESDDGRIKPSRKPQWKTRNSKK